MIMIKADPRLRSWFPISVFDWDPDDPVDIRPAVTDNHDDDDDDDDGGDDDDKDGFYWLLTNCFWLLRTL